MKIRVIVKAVGDGDALFFVLERDAEVLVGVIDGGRQQDSDKTIPHLDELLAEYGKDAPDLVIGTHYDNDHIAGLLPLLRHYKNPGVKLWMFDTSSTLARIERTLEYPEDESGIFPKEDQLSIGSVYGEQIKKAEEFLLTSLKKEKEVIEYARALGMEISEPVAGKCAYPNWPEIMVLGPTQAYYDQLFPERLESRELVEDLIRAAGVSPVSRVNLLSAIIRIQGYEKSFLFTGDAGIDSFMAIPDYQNMLGGLYWLKMPHHGSANNMNERLLEIMRPQQVYISGDRYLDEDLVKCMRSRGILVRTTKDEGDLEITI